MSTRCYYGGYFTNLALPAPPGAEGDLRYRDPRPPRLDAPKSTRGPYRLYSPQIAERILKAIMAGVSIKAAARYAGISPDTLTDWLRLGRKNKHPELRDLFMRVKQARADAHVGSAYRIRSSKDWRAHAWWLERSFPEDWKPEARVRVAHSPIKIDFSGYRDIRQAQDDARTFDAQRAVVAHDRKMRARLRRELLEKHARNGGSGSGGGTNGASGNGTTG